MESKGLSTQQAIRLLTRTQAAQWLNISVRKLDGLAADGRLRCIKIDRAVRYAVSDLEDFTASCASTTCEER